MAASTTAKQTARPGEPEAEHRARVNAIGAAAGTEAGTNRATEVPAAEGNEHPASNLPAVQHAAQPDHPADSTVRHAEPATGKQGGEGSGGFPQGEYDVTNPAPAPAGGKFDATKELVRAHLGSQDVGQIKQALKQSALGLQGYAEALEAAPVGFVLEHEAPNRWRCHKVGVMRFGHGQSAVEAVENYVLGTNATAEEAGARAFAKLSSQQQREIRERDEASAQALGGSSSDSFAREEARKSALKAQSAKAPAGNAVTDASEQGSAQAQQGTPKAKASTKRAAARKRVTEKQSGAKKASGKR